MWKQSCRARLPSKSESGRCENEAVVRNFPQRVKVANVKTELSCESCSNFENSKCENSAWTRSSNAGPLRPWSEHSRDRLAPVRLTSFPVLLPRHVLSCKTQHFVHLLSLKNAFHARLPSKSESGRYENEGFARDFPQKVKVEDVYMKMWRRSFRARLPSKSESGRCENEAFVRDVLQIPPVEDVIMKLSARLPSKSASGRCENQALARDFPQKMNLESRSCLLFQATFA